MLAFSSLSAAMHHSPTVPAQLLIQQTSAQGRLLQQASPNYPRLLGLTPSGMLNILNFSILHCPGWYLCVGV